MQMLLGCLLFICVVINKNFIIVLLHKPEYAGYFNVFIVVSIGFLADMTGGVNGYIINLSKYYRLTTYFILSAVAFCGIANWILIPRMGMIGAAAAYSLAMIFLNFLYWLYVKLKFNLQPFGTAHLLIILISVIALCVGEYLPANTNLWIDLVFRSGTVIIICATLTYFFKISPDITVIINKLLNINRDNKY